MRTIGRMISVATTGAALAALAACSGADKKEEAPATTAETPTAGTNAATPAAPAAAPVAYASLTGDATKGARVFLQCKTCHVLEEGQNRIGPSLWGVVGRKAGQIAGFAYSDANKNSGLTWTEETLYEYLEDPRKKVPGTKMVFAGLKVPQDRADVIAYLKGNGK